MGGKKMVVKCPKVKLQSGIVDLRSFRRSAVQLDSHYIYIKIKQLLQKQMNRSGKKQDAKSKFFSKQIVKNNPIFTIEEIDGFYKLFTLYQDIKGLADPTEIMITAKTLSYDKKHHLVFNAITKIVQLSRGGLINFEQFLVGLTDNLGNPFTEEGRKAMMELVDLQGKGFLTFNDLIRVTDYLGLNYQPNQIQVLIRKIGGPGAKTISWQQFNDEIKKKKFMVKQK